MNILLVTDQDKIKGDDYLITKEKFSHLKEVLKVKVGQKVYTGKVNGLMGYSTVLEINTDHIIINAQFNIKPPPPLPITVIMALPRPKMLRRILRNISMLGVKNIYLINTFKVEKSFWKSKVLEKENIEAYLLQGLEQSKDTIIPKLEIRNRFKPFVEDEVPSIIQNTTALLAHPGDYPAFPQGTKDPLTLAVGPEGGFSNYEVKKFNEAGFNTVHCGQRILRTETALVALISQHYFLLNK